jgi:hypothetical protein
MEYSTTPGQWCHSPASLAREPALAPPRSPPATACALQGTQPPLRVANQPYRVRVTASATTDGFFARSIGLGDLPPPAGCLRPAGAPGITTCASAVVTIQINPGGPEYAVFAREDDCAQSNAGTFVSGSNITITGGAHTNSEFDVSGNNIDFNGATTFSCPPGDNSIDGNHVRVNGAAFSSTSTDQVAQRPSPLSYTLADFPCTYGVVGGLLVPVSGIPADVLLPSPYTIGGNNRTFPPGVYSVNGDHTLDGNNFSGQVTFVATGRVSLLGNNYDFTPHRNNVQVFSNHGLSGAPAVYVDTNNLTMRGVIYAPNGVTDVHGNNYDAFNVAIVAWRVRLTGNNLRLVGTGQGVHEGSLTVGLTE